LLLALAGAAPARAQAPSGAAAAARAELEAYGASRDPALLLRLAEARLALGDGPGAVEALERFLTVAPLAPEAEAVRARIVELEQAPARLAIVSAPPGAEVRVDGAPLGEAPLELEVAAGAHRLELRLPGYAPSSQPLVLTYASRRVVEVALAPEPVASVEAPIEAEPVAPPAVVEVAEPGGRRLGPAAWATSGLAAGALLTGTVFGFMALDQESEFDLHPTEARADRGERDALVADICFGVAGASAITALVLWLRPHRAAPRDATAARLSFGGRGLRLEF
jgi:hypothetical protein